MKSSVLPCRKDIVRHTEVCPLPFQELSKSAAPIHLRARSLTAELFPRTPFETPVRQIRVAFLPPAFGPSAGREQSPHSSTKVRGPQGIQSRATKSPRRPRQGMPSSASLPSLPTSVSVRTRYQPPRPTLPASGDGGGLRHHGPLADE